MQLFFECHNAPRVTFVEEDLAIAPDFFSYMNELALASWNLTRLCGASQPGMTMAKLVAHQTKQHCTGKYSIAFNKEASTTALQASISLHAAMFNNLHLHLLCAISAVI